jgi:hypothetical protein
MFFDPENQPSTYQLSPAIHHNFTTKKPRSTTRFCQKPQQKPGPTTPKKYCKSAPLRAGFCLLRGMTTAATLSWSSRSRTLAPPNPHKTLRLGECSRDVPKPQCTKFSPEKIASPKDLILCGFSRVLRGVKADRNYAWTYWRRVGDSNPR